MQVFDPVYGPSVEAVKVEKGPCPCSHDWDLPRDVRQLGSRASRLGL